VRPHNGTQEDEDSSTPVNIVQKRKKQLLSSVRGWLLYKSALDLWDDVNSQHLNSLPNNKQGNSSANAKHPLALHQSSSVGHLVTLGRFSGDKNQAAMTLPTDVQRPLPKDAKSMEMLTSTRKKSLMSNGVGGGAMVKRSKSLWKFRRFNRDDDGILEGMSLWQHRSLVDVHIAVQQEEEATLSTPTTVKRKSTGTNTSQTVDAESPSNNKCPTPLMRMKLVPLKDDEDILNGSVETPPKPMERKSIKSSQNGGISTNVERNDRIKSPMPAPKKPPTRNNIDSKDDDGLLIPRPVQQYCSSEEEDDDDEDDDEEENTDLENGDSESCIVVDDHTKAKINLSRRQQILKEARASIERGTLLPRTRLVKERGRKTRVEIPNSADGLLYYGRTLQYRLKKPERGSRFDEVSEITGNMYGPWYDLWGIDSSVRQ
jgi:hypothetical protein